MIMFTRKESIINWLKDMNVTDYYINDNLTINVDGNVNISNKGLLYIPVQFKEVYGTFNCSNNNLTNLKGTPSDYCYLLNANNNKITTLEYAPLVIGSLSILNNKLTSLKTNIKKLKTL